MSVCILDHVMAMSVKLSNEIVVFFFSKKKRSVTARRKTMLVRATAALMAQGELEEE